jgi:hypothetical protein
MKIIKAKEISSLLEAYLTRLKSPFQDFYPQAHPEGFEVFINPSKKDLRDLDVDGNGIRFSADDITKKVYAYPVFASFHSEVRKQIGVKCRPNSRYLTWCSHILDGVAERSGSVWKMTEGNSLAHGFQKGNDLTTRDLDCIREALLIDWSWADPYIQVSDYINKLRNRKLSDER